MIVNITFKTPDAVYYALKDDEIPEDEKEDLEEFLGEYIKNGEYITIEFDTETKTATVRKL
jgi:hypothetical protein